MNNSESHSLQAALRERIERQALAPCRTVPTTVEGNIEMQYASDKLKSTLVLELRRMSRSRVNGMMDSRSRYSLHRLHIYEYMASRIHRISTKFI